MIRTEDKRSKNKDND